MPWSMQSARSKRGRSSRLRRRARRNSARRHARGGGHPVIREFAANENRRGILDHPPSRMMTPFQDQLYRPYCGGATGATPPVGTVASAVLVDLADAACDFSALTVSLTKRS